ncbi:hypothetical protein D9611_011885 [Ephemerocybe angulata]|uniref:CCHC-type domain-containing protein n=1 Tax=Ephemerocybe angulata TaxID=980116 RepID=A0A8H5FC55_9AGAR|nr:hypothetical protein D9611_011885 [Tulosesus angulatus]
MSRATPPGGAARTQESISTVTARGLETATTEAQRVKDAEKVLKANGVIAKVEEARTMKKFIGAIREFATNKKTLTKGKQTQIFTDGTEKKNLEAIATILERLTGDGTGLGLGLGDISECVRGELDLMKYEIHDTVKEESEKARLALAALTEEVRELREARGTAAGATGTSPRSYSSIVAAGLQAAAPPALIAKKAGQGRQFRYRLEPESLLLEKDKSPQDLANIVRAQLQELEPGNEVKIRTVTRVEGQPMVQIELAGDKDAKWMRTDWNSENLGAKLQGKVEERTATMIVEKIPTTFDPTTGLREVEEANGYATGDIVSCRWLKAINRRYPGQLQAHAIMTFKNADTANRAKDTRLSICGTMVQVRKDKKEPHRCGKCHMYGHWVKDCKAKEDVCGTCGTTGHRTSDCTTQQKRACISCKGGNHASWDRRCPEFLRRCHDFDQRHPENTMPYHPTEDAWTWMREPTQGGQTSTYGASPPITYRPTNQTRRIQETRRLEGYEATWQQHQREDQEAGRGEKTTTGEERLRILQININKSAHAQLALLNDELPHDWDIILLQEPSANYYNHISTPRGFRQVYPGDEARKTGTVRSGIWVNEGMSTDAWTPLDIGDALDVTGIRISGENGKLTIFSVYYDCTHNRTGEALRKYIEENEEEIYGDGGHVMWAGDFNRHHPMWDRDEDTRLFTRSALDEATTLIEFAEEWGMEQVLEKGIPTLEHSATKLWTRPDNVWLTAHSTTISELQAWA